jgi:hypothetical protein
MHPRTQDLSSVFCSELVVAALQKMELVSERLAANSFLPKDLADKTNKVTTLLKQRATKSCRALPHSGVGSSEHLTSCCGLRWGLPPLTTHSQEGSTNCRALHTFLLLPFAVALVLGERFI